MGGKEGALLASLTYSVNWGAHVLHGRPGRYAEKLANFLTATAWNWEMGFISY